MEEMEFAEKALQDAELRDFLEGIADQARAEVELDVPRTYTIGGADVLMFLLACTLYRWVKQKLDYSHQKQQNEILEERAKIVGDLMEKGLSLKDAQAFMTTSLKSMEQLSADDPVMKKVTNLLH